MTSTNLNTNTFTNGAFEYDSNTYELEIVDTNFNKLSSNQVRNVTGDTSLVWHNLRFSASNLFGKKKVILNRLNGHLKYHSLNGFLGPSGAGKTTLLNCLNGTYKSGLSVDSEIYFNKNEKDSPSIRFIEQHVHETMIGQMTVGHILFYAFRFKNGFRQSSKMKQHIGKVLDELLLQGSILDTPLEKCSGGEQKRIAVAQELMSLEKPTFLFVDEPTTGLDSHAALLMIQCLRRLADNNRMTILASIHTPNTEVLNHLDTLYILAKGGVCIYSGPPSGLRQHHRLLMNREIDEEKPAIEEYIRTACLGSNHESVQRMTSHNIEEFKEEFPLIQEKLKFLPKGVPQARKFFNIGDFFLQFYRIFHIVFVVQKKAFLAQLGLFFAIYMIMASLFGTDLVKAKICFPYNSNWRVLNQTCQERLDDEDYVRQYQIYLLYSTYLSGLCILAMSAVLFLPILKVFRNEHRNRWYSMGTFYWPFVIIRFIEMSILSVWTAILAYFAINTQYVDDGAINWTRLGSFILFFWLWNLFLQSLGHTISLIFVHTPEYAVLACQVMYIGFMFLNNFPYNLEKLNLSILTVASDFLGTNVYANGLVYSFYVLDRCPETQYSYVIDDFGLKVDTVYSDTKALVINSFLYRFSSIFLLLLRFSAQFTFKTFRRSSKGETKQIDTTLASDTKKDFEVDINKITRVKEEKELHCEAFTSEKIILAWRNVTLFAEKSIYEIRSSKAVDPNSKLILKNVSGQFYFGTLNALMGTSGAGKTSLLKVLNGQSKTRLSEESQFFLSKFTPIRGCYITQEVSGHLMNGLTVKQSLIYASKLKNIYETQKIDHEHIAMNILKELDLTDCPDTPVQSCSGGQRKRLALGLELTALRMPNLICIDEPTSGLDSNSAEVVVANLKKVVHAHNITILASIHQPSTEVLTMFDHVYALARGGVCIYSGPPSEIRNRLSHVCEEINNPKVFPVESLIQYSCLDYKDAKIKDMARLTEEYILSENSHLLENTTFLPDGIPLNRNRFSLKSVHMLMMRYMYYVKGHHWKTIAFIWYLYFILYMTVNYIFRSNLAYRTGCLNIEEDFNEFCEKTEDRVHEKFELKLITFKLISSFVAYLFFLLLLSALEFNREIVYFTNEHRNGWYSTGAFYMMKTIWDVLHSLPVTLLYIWSVNIFEIALPGTYYGFITLIILGAFSLQAAGGFFSQLSRGQFSTMLVLMNAFIVMYQMIGSIGPAYVDLHYIYQFLSHFSPLRFVFEGGLLLIFGFGRCRKRVEIQQILYHLKMENDEHYFYCILMLVFNCILYRVLTLAILMIKSNPAKNRRVRAAKILEYHSQLKTSNAKIPGLTCHHEFTVKKIEIGSNLTNGDAV